MRILVTGVKGQLGHDVMEELAKRGDTGIGVDIEEMDITDPDSVGKVIRESDVSAVIHCAAWTAVDKAEECVDLCRKVNAYGTENIAKVCEELDLPMMYFSTDYVFDGNGTRPWEPEDERHPLDVYGQTKAEGEIAVLDHVKKSFILRIAWVFGINGHNFIRTMLKLAKTHDRLRVVNDQIGTPTYTYDLARLVVDMIKTDKYGIYHVTNEGGYISWYDFAVAIFKEAGITGCTLEPVTSEEYGAKAKRPYNSRMDRSKIAEEGFAPLPSWEDALSRYVKILKEEGEA